jgi:hypothetical protein
VEGEGLNYQTKCMFSAMKFESVIICYQDEYVLTVYNNGRQASDPKQII